MVKLMERFSNLVKGSLTGFDRIVLKGFILPLMTAKHRPNTRMYDIDKRTNGWKRRTEALSKKTDILVQMADRAHKAGIDASFMLFDSWFSHDDTISRIYKVGYNVICRLKKNRVKF